MNSGIPSASALAAAHNLMEGITIMDLFLVRLFNGKSWHTIRSYAIESEAESFAAGLSAEWDIKRVSLDQALALENN